MSADAVAYVWRYSPHKGAAFAVHLAIADSVNDQHEYRCWMTQDSLSQKTRSSVRSVRDALAALESSGFLQRVGGGKDRGLAVQFRFLFKRHISAVYDPRKAVDKGSADSAYRSAASSGGSADSAYVSPQGLSPEPEDSHHRFKVVGNPAAQIRKERFG